MHDHRTKNILLLAVAILSGLVAIFLIIRTIIWYGPSRPDTQVDEDVIVEFQVTADATKAYPGISQIETMPDDQEANVANRTNPTKTPITTATPEWMVYQGIDLRNREIALLFTMQCAQDTIYVEPFRVMPFSPEILDSGEFLTNFDFAIAWDHLGYYGLWIHSGRAEGVGELPAYPLQIYLENDERGFRRDIEAFEAHLQECVMGGEVRIQQNGTTSVHQITAAVRVPPSEVDEVSRHPMELVPYLSEKYPGNGFEALKQPGLIFYFCGRQLTGETSNENYDYWTQSRIIIGVEPVGE